MAGTSTEPGQTSARRWARRRIFTGMEWVIGIAILGVLALTLAISLLAIT